MSQPTDPTDPAAYSGFADPAATPAATPPAGGGFHQLPDPYAAAPAPAPVLLAIGDMSITQTHVITPAGTYPLNGSYWSMTDYSTHEQATPQWAIVAAIVGFFLVCALSLLFLLVKEDKVGGYVQVTVQGPGWSHVTNLPAGTGQHVQAQVAYVQQLVAALPSA